MGHLPSLANSVFLSMGLLYGLIFVQISDWAFIGFYRVHVLHELDGFGSNIIKNKLVYSEK